MRIPRTEAAAVLVDVQERLFPHIHQNERLLERLSVLIQGLNLLQVPILVTEQYSKGLGPTIAPLRELLESYRPIEKMTFSCCGEDKFAERLSILGRRHIILMGIESHVCVFQTALDLLAEGYRPFIVTDAVSSRRAGDMQTALKRLRSEGVLPTTTESLLFELLESAEHPAFKAISKLVK